ncbi:hypothetical protein RA086_06695 [Lactiplantibacillus sp. WILCCON 0030]|uniref:LPXTG cell wall anchor domain-containing protein n=1 Tax=Lactiplantibacillus brownii TaxID=3069269 RepID=A0ABU1A8Q9_9LACO|nr:hypothetical protein [Lactiplantibacillus brownii]MDQ7937314.1 hypothetical protein [Lactiplantibacillus brownii]
MKSHQEILVWLTGLRDNGHTWRWLIVFTMSLFLFLGGCGWQAQASVTSSTTAAPATKVELYDSRTGAMLSMATKHDTNANRVNQIGLAFLTAGVIGGSFCWYRLKRSRK